MLSRIVRTTGLLCLTAFLACGTTISFQTPAGAIAGGQPVNATADFNVTAGTITLTLTNLIVNPTSVVQNVSGILFDVTSPDLTKALIGSGFSGTGTPITINGSGNGSLGSSGATNWALNDSGSLLAICAVCAGGPGPASTLIGQGVGGSQTTYSNANGSIAGNGPHNPFYYNVITFTITNPGITENTAISSVSFLFGTSPDTIGGTQIENLPPDAPEPATFSLAAGGLLLLGARALKNWRTGRS